MSFRNPFKAPVAPELSPSPSQDFDHMRRASRSQTETSSSLISQFSLSGGMKNETEFWIDHPILCGYLLAFCESQYNAENINFIMEIDRFRDLMSADKQSWSKHWKELDDAIGLVSKSIAHAHIPECSIWQGPEELALGLQIISQKFNEFIEFISIMRSGNPKDWPSKLIPREAVVEYVYFIWNKYLSDSAPHQICIPSKVLTNTKV